MRSNKKTNNKKCVDVDAMMYFMNFPSFACDDNCAKP